MIVVMIDDLIKERGVMQKDVCEACGLYSSFFKKARDGNDIRLENVIKLCDYFKCQPNKFLIWVDDRYKNDLESAYEENKITHAKTKREIVEYYASL